MKLSSRSLSLRKTRARIKANYASAQKASELVNLAVGQGKKPTVGNYTSQGAAGRDKINEQMAQGREQFLVSSTSSSRRQSLHLDLDEDMRRAERQRLLNQFKDLQRYSARPSRKKDQVATTIRGEIFKGNQKIQSRSDNILNLAAADKLEQVRLIEDAQNSFITSEDLSSKEAGPTQAQAPEPLDSQKLNNSKDYRKWQATSNRRRPAREYIQGILREDRRNGTLLETIMSGDAKSYFGKSSKTNGSKRTKHSKKYLMKRKSQASHLQSSRTNQSLKQDILSGLHLRPSAQNGVSDYFNRPGTGQESKRTPAQWGAQGVDFSAIGLKRQNARVINSDDEGSPHSQLSEGEDIQEAALRTGTLGQMKIPRLVSISGRESSSESTPDCEERDDEVTPTLKPEAEKQINRIFNISEESPTELTPLQQRIIDLVKMNGPLESKEFEEAVLKKNCRLPRASLLAHTKMFGSSINLTQKTEAEIEQMLHYFNEFDFLKNQQPALQHREEEAMAKDKKSMEQMCRVMKYFFVPKNRIIFDYEDQGDLFYMVIQGKVLCKVPFMKQLILLSLEEKRLFEEQFKDDLISIQEATEVNRQLNIKSKDKTNKTPPKKNKIDLTKLQQLKNPYDLDRADLEEYLLDIQSKELHVIIKKQQPMLQKRLKQIQWIQRSLKRHTTVDFESSSSSSSPEEDSGCSQKSNAEGPSSDEEDSVSDRELQDEIGGSLQEATAGAPRVRAFSLIANGPGSSNNLLQFKSISKIKRSIKNAKGLEKLTYQQKIQSLALLAEIDSDFQRLREACQTVLENPNQNKRKYYFVNIMKVVRTYEADTSFGELAIITNKRRKAKLETTADTHFAVLSKEDYRQAQYRVQNQILKDKINFLKQFDLFSNLSESNLSVLSYSQQEHVFHRGQTVYEEGIDSVDKIYLIQSGEFEITKQLIKPKQWEPNLEGSALDRREDLKRKYANESVDPSEIKEKGPLRFDLKKFTQREKINQYSVHTKTSEVESIKVCILGNHDIFGFQELLERDISLRSCTVKCLRNNSKIISLEKSVLVTIIRRTPQVLDMMKVKWTEFLLTRLSNKIYVDQLLSIRERAKEILPIPKSLKMDLPTKKKLGKLALEEQLEKAAVKKTEEAMAYQSVWRPSPTEERVSLVKKVTKPQSVSKAGNLECNNVVSSELLQAYIKPRNVEGDFERRDSGFSTDILELEDKKFLRKSKSSLQVYKKFSTEQHHEVQVPLNQPRESNQNTDQVQSLQMSPRHSPAQLDGGIDLARMKFHDVQRHHNKMLRLDTYQNRNALTVRQAPFMQPPGKRAASTGRQEYRSYRLNKAIEELEAFTSLIDQEGHYGNQGGSSQIMRTFVSNPNNMSSLPGSQLGRAPRQELHELKKPGRVLVSARSTTKAHRGTSKGNQRSGLPPSGGKASSSRRSFPKSKSTLLLVAGKDMKPPSSERSGPIANMNSLSLKAVYDSKKRLSSRKGSPQKYDSSSKQSDRTKVQVPKLKGGLFERKGSRNIPLRGQALTMRTPDLQAGDGILTSRRLGGRQIPIRPPKIDEILVQGESSKNEDPKSTVRDPALASSRDMMASKNLRISTERLPTERLSKDQSARKENAGDVTVADVVIKAESPPPEKEPGNDYGFPPATKLRESGHVGRPPTSSSSKKKTSILERIGFMEKMKRDSVLKQESGFFNRGSLMPQGQTAMHQSHYIEGNTSLKMQLSNSNYSQQPLNDPSKDKPIAQAEEPGSSVQGQHQVSAAAQSFDFGRLLDHRQKAADAVIPSAKFCSPTKTEKSDSKEDAAVIRVSPTRGVDDQAQGEDRPGVDLPETEPRIYRKEIEIRHKNKVHVFKVSTRGQEGDSNYQLGSHHFRVGSQAVQESPGVRASLTSGKAPRTILSASERQMLKHRVNQSAASLESFKKFYNGGNSQISSMSSQIKNIQIAPQQISCQVQLKQPDPLVQIQGKSIPILSQPRLHPKTPLAWKLLQSRFFKSS